MPDAYHDQITLGEIYRLVLAQSSDLAVIKADVRSQTSSMAGHETRLAILEERGGGKSGAIAGGSMAGVVLGAVEILKFFAGKP